MTELPPEGNALRDWETSALRAEMDHLQYVLNDLRLIWWHFPMQMLTPLHQRYSARYAELHAEFARRENPDAAPAVVATEPAATSVASEPTVAATAEVAPVAPGFIPDTPTPSVPWVTQPAPRDATPWLREFVTDHAILILSYLGGLALIVATILFEIYTANDIGGVVRFAVVLAVTAAFGAAGLACLRRPKLEIVGRSYLLVFALMAPLVGGAAYRFLNLHAVGISPDVAVSIGATYSLIIYALLARRINSTFYAFCALLGIPIALTSAVGDVVTAEWLGAVTIIAAPLLTAIAYTAQRREEWTLFALPAQAVAHIVAAIVILMSVGPVSSDLTLVAGHVAPAVILYEAAVAYAAMLAAHRRGVEFWLAQAALMAAVLFGADALRLDVAWWSGALMLIAALDIAWAVVLRDVLAESAVLGLRIAAHISTVAALLTSVSFINLAASPVAIPRHFALTVALAAVAYIAMFALFRGLADVWLAGAATITVILATSAAWGVDSAWTGGLLMVLGALSVGLTVPANRDIRLALTVTALACLEIAAALPLAEPARTLILCGGVLIAASLSVVWRASQLMAAAGTAILIQVTVAGMPLASASPPLMSYLTISTALLAIALAGLGWLLRSEETWVFAGLAGSATALLTCYTFAAPTVAYTTVLTGLGAAYAAVPLIRRNVRFAELWRGAALAQITAAAFVVAAPSWAESLVMLVATAVVLVVALDGRNPNLMLGVGGLAAWDWYWMADAFIPKPVNPGPSTLALLYTPFAIAWVVGAMALRLANPSDTAKPWAERMELVAGVSGSAAVFLALGGIADYALVGWILLIGSGLTYLDGRLAGDAWKVQISAAAGTGSLLAFLVSNATAAANYPIALAALGGAVFGLALAYNDFNSLWSRFHRESGLVIAAMGAGYAIFVPAFHQLGNPGGMSGLAASLVFALLLIAESRLGRDARLEYAGILVASVSTIWISGYAGLTNPQAYVLIPSLTLIALGVRSHDDSRIHPGPEEPRTVVAVGLVAMLGLSAIQGLGTGPDTTAYIALLFVESLAAIVASISARDRTLLAGGGAGVAVAGLQALNNVVQAIPLYVVFALAAVVLLGLATVLAASRQQVAETRNQVRTAWQSWR